jgi:secreted effector protein SseB
VAALIAKITDPSNKDQDQALTPDIIKYLQANGISVDGVDLNKPGQYDKATLQLVKNAIDNVQTSASNFVQTAQLKIQQVMQTYNIATQMVNSLLSIGAEMNKSIASSIR